MVRIHRRLPLGLTLRAALGIPWSSVGSETIGVGTDRLARALAARRQRLSVGAQPRLLRWALAFATWHLRAHRVLATGTARTTRTTTTATAFAARPVATRVRSLRTEVALAGTEARHETARARAAVLSEGVLSAARTTGATARTASAARTTSAARTASATRTTRTTRTTTAIAAGTTWAAATTRTATTARTTASAAITEVARRRRELPTDTGARHLAATRTVVFLLLFLLRAELEATEAARLVAIAAATEAAGTATTTAATTALTTLASATFATLVAAALRRTGDAIDHVVVLAARDRAVRTLLALEHANEANLIDAITDDVERLEQTLGAIRLHAERGCDGIGRRILRGRRGLRACFSCAVAARFASGVARCFDRCFATRFTARFASCVARCLDGRFSGLRSRRLLGRGRRLDGGRRSRPGSTRSRACGCRIPKQQRGELGERFHGTGLLHQRGDSRHSRDATFGREFLLVVPENGQRRPEAAPRGECMAFAVFETGYEPAPTEPDASTETSTDTFTLAWMLVAALTAAAT